MRKFHKLRVNEKLTYPESIFFIDTETTTIKADESEHEPRLILGVIEYVKVDTTLKISEYKRLIFRDLDSLYEFLDNILKGCKKALFFAHNWSFDFPVIDGFNRLSLLNFKMLSIVDQSPPTIINYKRPGCHLTIIDSLNFFRQSLKSMGKAIGVEKLEAEFDTMTDEQLETYCKRDVEILRKSILSLINFLSENNLCRLTHTVSSLALTTFVRRFTTTQIFIDGDPDRVGISRKSYLGGRTECFYIGKKRGRFHLIDVNSQYPSVMRNFDFPVKSTNHYKLCVVEDLRAALKKHCLTIRCDVDIDEPYLPFKIAGRTCFPTGKFTTYLSTPEIQYALEHKHIVKVHEMVLHKKARIFQDYIDHFYKKRMNYRRDGNESYQEFCKKMLNTLYGKFGQQGNTWKKCDEERKAGFWKWQDFDQDTRKMTSYMYIDNQVFVSVKKSESRDSYPAIAAHVTAHARMMVWLTIKFVGIKNVLYCDTDSLLLNQRGYNKMRHKIDNKSLGCWGYVAGYKNVHIRAPKDYKFDSLEKIKGVKMSKITKTQSQLLEGGGKSNKEEFAYIKDKSGGYKQLQFTNLKGTIRSGKLNTPVIRNITKKLKRNYSKGNVQQNGRVLPFRLFGDF